MCLLPGQSQPARRHKQITTFVQRYSHFIDRPREMWQEDRGHLVVIQIQQSQVSHFTEGACRDLRNPVLTEPELFKTGRQT